MLERLIHEPLAREIGQPLLTLSSLNKINNNNNNNKLIIHTYNASMKVKRKSYITIKLYKVAEAHTTTTAKIVLTNAVLLRFIMIVPTIGALRKDQA